MIKKSVASSKNTGKSKIPDKTRKPFADRFLFILIISSLFIIIVILISAIGKRINVAKVNGHVITRSEFYKELEKSEGSAVLEDMITKKIIFQEAKNNNIVIPASEIESEINIIRNTVTQQGSSLEDILAYQGITYEQLLENVRIQKILEKLLESSIDVTDEDIRLRYDENKDIYGSEKTFEDLKEDIKYQLYQEEITAVYRNWIEEKRSSAVIEKYIN